MANQDPQPEVYSVSSTFDDLSGGGLGTLAGATIQTTINTNQANNEEVRVYAIQVDIQGADFAALSPLTGTNCDFSLTVELADTNSCPLSATILGYNHDKSSPRHRCGQWAHHYYQFH